MKPPLFTDPNDEQVDDQPVWLALRSMPGFASGVLLACVVVFGQTVGCQGSKEPDAADAAEQSTRFVVDGPSMTPTLWGESMMFRCGECRRELRVERSFWSDRNSSAANKPTCPFCGERRVLKTIGEVIPPEIVEVLPLSKLDVSLKQGDLVVLVHQGRHHVKRIMATPGQTVFVGEDQCWHVKQGQLAPRVVVNQDHGASVSRWFPDEHMSASQSIWQRSIEGTAIEFCATRSSLEAESRATVHTQPGSSKVVERDREKRPLTWQWLVYEHRNVHRGGVPSRILDDHLENIGLARKLRPVRGIAVSAVVELTDSVDLAPACQTRAAFWSEDGLHVSPIWPVQSKSCITLRHGDSRPAAQIKLSELPSLSATRPIALGVAFQPAMASLPNVPRAPAVFKITDLAVQRDVIYPRSESDFGDHVTLGAQQWFVAGDNAPLSVDSRKWGPVETESIVGKVWGVEGNSVNSSSP